MLTNIGIYLANVKLIMYPNPMKFCHCRVFYRAKKKKKKSVDRLLDERVSFINHTKVKVKE